MNRQNMGIAEADLASSSECIRRKNARLLNEYINALTSPTFSVDWETAFFERYPDEGLYTTCQAVKVGYAGIQASREIKAAKEEPIKIIRNLSESLELLIGLASGQEATVEARQHITDVVHSSYRNAQAYLKKIEERG